MKAIHIFYVLIASIILWGCSEADNEIQDDYLGSLLPDNEMVFEVKADVTPMSHHITLKDTMWISIHIDDSVFTDKISEQEITLPLTQSRFILQLEVNDLIDNKAANAKIIERNGTVVEVKNGVITATFGHPDAKPYLDLGLVFPDIGKYALVLHNYPNPFLDDAKEACTDSEECNDIWFDLLFGKDPVSGELTYKAFIEYRFNIGELATSDSQLNKYTDVSTYNNSIYPVTVR